MKDLIAKQELSNIKNLPNILYLVNKEEIENKLREVAISLFFSHLRLYKNKI